jgi:hypothetical protein
MDVNSLDSVWFEGGAEQSGAISFFELFGLEAKSGANPKIRNIPVSFRTIWLQKIHRTRWNRATPLSLMLLSLSLPLSLAGPPA